MKASSKKVQGFNRPVYRFSTPKISVTCTFENCKKRYKVFAYKIGPDRDLCPIHRAQFHEREATEMIAKNPKLLKTIEYDY